jgi:hypothetical protein
MNLRVNKSEDNERILAMTKEEIITYYENLLDKCQDAILRKRDKIHALQE